MTSSYSDDGDSLAWPKHLTQPSDSGEIQQFRMAIPLANKNNDYKMYLNTFYPAEFKSDVRKILEQRKSKKLSDAQLKAELDKRIQQRGIEIVRKMVQDDPMHPQVVFDERQARIDVYIHLGDIGVDQFLADQAADKSNQNKAKQSQAK